MHAPIRWLVSLLTPMIVFAPAAAHYHILLPERPSANRDEAITFTYHFGHPFEHQMFPTQKPLSFTLLLPDGQTVEQLPKLERIEEEGVEDPRVMGYRWKFTPTQRGDHIVAVLTQPIWMSEEKEFLQDIVKVVLHVQTQNGWDNAIGVGMEFIPLTRPYGLQSGMIFQAQLFGPSIDQPDGPQRRLPRTLVEVERYNSQPPKERPPEEHITRVVKTDPNGVVTVTLPEPGWWALTAVRDGGTLERTGREYPLKFRTTLWVYVDGPVSTTSGK